jgi:arylsulfatase A-like enzyme
MDFLQRLDTIVPPSERVVIITSDHGEELFGHGRVQHGDSLFGDVLSVPLIVQYPDRTYGRVDLAPASGVDVVPTVLDTLGLEVPGELAGRSLREASTDPIARVAQHGSTAHAVQFDGWKLIVGPVAGSNGRPDAVQLYDLHADPGELEDIAQAVPEWVRRLQGMLDESRQLNRPLGPRPAEGHVDPAVLGDLRMLGVSGGR